MEWTTLVTTLLAIGAFVMSGLSLYISSRKDKFEREVVTAEQTAVLLSKIGEQRVNLLKYDDLLAKLRRRYSANGDSRLQSIELFQKAIDLMSPNIEDTFFKIQSNHLLSYRDIKMQQSHYDLLNSILAFVMQGTDELLKEDKS